MDSTKYIVHVAKKISLQHKNIFLYYIWRNYDMMTISEQIKVLCVRQNISLAELARRLGKSPQSFNSKMKKESFTVEELEKIATVTGSTFERNFILMDGEKV